MKRTIALLTALVMLLSLCPIEMCSALAGNLKVTLPADMKVIEAEAFAGDAAITDVVIPANIEQIDAKAFAGCTNL